MLHVLPPKAREGGGGVGWGVILWKRPHRVTVSGSCFLNLISSSSHVNPNFYSRLYCTTSNLVNTIWHGSFQQTKYKRFSNEAPQNLSCGAASDSLFCSMLAYRRQQQELFENIGNLNTILSFNTFLPTSCYVRQNIFSPEGGSAKYPWCQAGFYKYTSSTT